MCKYIIRNIGNIHMTKVYYNDYSNFNFILFDINICLNKFKARH